MEGRRKEEEGRDLQAKKGEEGRDLLGRRGEEGRDLLGGGGGGPGGGGGGGGGDPPGEGGGGASFSLVLPEEGRVRCSLEMRLALLVFTRKPEAPMVLAEVVGEVLLSVMAEVAVEGGAAGISV